MINTLLIIIYNIDNYIGIICSNKIFTITIFEAKDKKENLILKNNKSISYRLPNICLYIIIILQNFILFSTIENYINQMIYKLIFKYVIAIFLFLIIIIYFLNQMNKYNYSNFINNFINTLFLFCFYSIIIDFIIYISKYRLIEGLNEIIYLFIKLFLAFITNILFNIKTHIFLKSKISEILFHDKINKNKIVFISSFYFLHEIMLLIKEQCQISQAFSLSKILNEHISKCNKRSCNCKLIECFIKNNNKYFEKEDKKRYISDLLNALNYLFESSFIDFNFYNNYDLAILLAEHFCHLKNNPTMSFSLISTCILNQRNKYSKIQMVTLYELSQKYIYYIIANKDSDMEMAIYDNKIEILLLKKKEDRLKTYYYNLNFSTKIKKLINKYIDNALKILQFKIIFEDSLVFQFDDNENIISVKINFFNQNTKIDNIYNSSNNRKFIKNKNLIKRKINNESNIYNITYLLKQEQLYFKEIINSINKIQASKDIPIFIIFKYFLFFDIFRGKIPDEIVNKLLSELRNKIILTNNIITNKQYQILKQLYNDQNNKINSKVYVLVEFKKDLRTKYFSENGALKLGYKQNDIINETIDILMPNEFCKSHLNAIKQLIIGNQISYSIDKQSYYFDKTSKILYSANFEGSLIYNITKSFIMMLSSSFNYEYEYRFMLNNNFELLSISRNFEDEYYLNQRIFQAYNINFMDILKIKPEKLNLKFENEFKKIKYQKLIRQIKTQEYFIPQFYVPTGEKIYGIMNINNYNNSKKYILSKIIDSKDKEEKFNELLTKTQTKINNNNYNDDEQENLIEKDSIKTSLNNIFINPREVIFHKTYNINLKKGIFIENLA